MYQNVSKPKIKAVNDTHRKNCALLNSVQGFIEIEAWLLLTFFLRLQNQLIPCILLSLIEE